MQLVLITTNFYYVDAYQSMANYRIIWGVVDWDRYNIIHD